MDLLIRQTLDFIKEDSSSSDTFLIESDNISYFFPKKIMEKTETPTSQDKKELRTEVVKQSFKLQPQETPKLDEMQELKTLMSKIAPQIKLYNEIPDDREAKKIANLWKEDLNTADVVILSYGQTPQEIKFLQNVAQALTTLIAPAKLIDATRFEKENKWEIFFSSFTLKLMIAPERHIWSKTNLSTFYRENPSSHLHFLDKTPLLLLSPISHYLKNPTLKKQLWKSIVLHLSS